MTKYLTNNYSLINLHKKPSTKSEIVTQIIYGESFSILRKAKKWFKIKIKEDGYKGYIQNKKFSNFLRPNHKISVLKAKVYTHHTHMKKDRKRFCLFALVCLQKV